MTRPIPGTPAVDPNSRLPRPPSGSRRTPPASLREKGAAATGHSGRASADKPSCKRLRRLDTRGPRASTGLRSVWSGSRFEREPRAAADSGAAGDARFDEGPRGNGDSRWALAITLLFQAAASAIVAAPLVAAPRLIDSLQIGATAVGIYVATVYVAAIVSSQWSAALIRTWGPIRVSQMGLGLSSVGILLLSTPVVGLAWVAAGLIGLGYGPISPASSEVLVRSTPRHRFGIAFAIRQTGVPIGGAVAGLLVPALLRFAQISVAFAGVALLGGVICVLAHPLSRRIDIGRRRFSGLPRWSAFWRPVGVVWADVRLRRLALCSGALSATQLAITSYLVSFLNLELGWTLAAAGGALAIAQGAGVAGRLVWGVAADRWLGDHRTLMVISSLTLVATPALGLVGAELPKVATVVLLSTAGATALGWSGVMASAFVRNVRAGQAADATAGSLFFTYCGIVLGPLLVGALAASLGSLRLVFLLLGLPLAMAWIAVVSLSETDGSQRGA